MLSVFSKPKPKRIMFVLIAAFLTCSSNFGLLAANSPFGGVNLFWQDGKPLEISSDRLEFNSGLSTLVFTGQVKVIRKGFELKADKLKISADDNGRVTELNASGSVKLNHSDWKAYAGEVIYKRETNELVLKDSPLLIKGDNRLRGALIRFLIEEDRIVVESASTTFKLKGNTGKNTQKRK